MTFVRRLALLFKHRQPPVLTDLEAVAHLLPLGCGVHKETCSASSLDGKK